MDGTGVDKNLAAVDAIWFVAPAPPEREDCCPPAVPALEVPSWVFLQESQTLVLSVPLHICIGAPVHILSEQCCVGIRTVNAACCCSRR